jgi:hypothetical protein
MKRRAMAGQRVVQGPVLYGGLLYGEGLSQALGPGINR